VEILFLLMVAGGLFVWWSMRNAAKRKALADAAMPSAIDGELQDAFGFDANFLEMTLTRDYVDEGDAGVSGQSKFRINRLSDGTWIGRLIYEKFSSYGPDEYKVRDGRIVHAYFEDMKDTAAGRIFAEDEAEVIARLKEEIQGKEFDRIVSSWLEERYQHFKSLGGMSVETMPVSRPRDEASETPPAPRAAPKAGHFCRECRTINEADAKFCKKCGEALNEGSGASEGET
jgi:hypothetical protein